MGRRDDIRRRLEAATPTPWVLGDRHPTRVNSRGPYCDTPVALAQSRENADLIAHAPADLRDLLAVADAAAVVIRAIISQGSGPAAPIFDEFDAAVEAARGDWFKVDGEAIDSLRAALDRLDNGGRDV